MRKLGPRERKLPEVAWQVLCMKVAFKPLFSPDARSKVRDPVSGPHCSALSISSACRSSLYPSVQLALRKESFLKAVVSVVIPISTGPGLWKDGADMGTGPASQVLFSPTQCEAQPHPPTHKVLFPFRVDTGALQLSLYSQTSSGRPPYSQNFLFSHLKQKS